jgi:malate dehydrogenase (oxaloacetate-decarboxylating)
LDFGPSLSLGGYFVDFVDRFVKAVKQELPQTCLQWEDFSTAHARPLLERYQNELLTFNDEMISPNTS